VGPHGQEATGCPRPLAPRHSPAHCDPLSTLLRPPHHLQLSVGPHFVTDHTFGHFSAHLATPHPEDGLCCASLAHLSVPTTQAVRTVPGLTTTHPRLTCWDPRQLFFATQKSRKMFCFLPNTRLIFRLAAPTQTCMGQWWVVGAAYAANGSTALVTTHSTKVASTPGLQRQEGRQRRRCGFSRLLNTPF
jgi:hypothetical protein